MFQFSDKNIEYLYDIILSLKTKEECHAFFEDICTVKELQDIAQRLKVARMLKEGNSYQEVSRETGASTATISRVNKCLETGSGYALVIKKIGVEK